jgi:alpha-ketoglutarate-dependent taurine dioxygenase
MASVLAPVFAFELIRTVAAINAALLEHKVIFFRGQHDLDDDGQLAFARLLGIPTTAHPTITSRGEPILPIDSRYEKANSWHTDVTFQLLQNRVIKLENTIRSNWEPGDLATPNWATQHYAVADYDDQFRRLNRVTLAGDIPVNVHGERSRVIAGDASHYADVVDPVLLAG